MIMLNIFKHAIKIISTVNTFTKLGMGNTQNALKSVLYL